MVRTYEVLAIRTTFGTAEIGAQMRIEEGERDERGRGSEGFRL